MSHVKNRRRDIAAGDDQAIIIIKLAESGDEHGSEKQTQQALDGTYLVVLLDIQLISVTK